MKDFLSLASQRQSDRAFDADLSVSQEYLALEDGPPIFRQGFTCPALLDIII